MLSLSTEAITENPEPLGKFPHQPTVAGVNAIRVAPDGSVWMAERAYGQLIKFRPNCTPVPPDDDCSDYYGPILDDEGLELDNPWGIAFYDPTPGSPSSYFVYV